jgi:Protein of unknown function (DUF1572)
MSTRRGSDLGLAISVVLTQFRQLHDEIRREVTHRTQTSLNLVPCAGANSVATIITHTLGSEAETLRAVAGVPAVRDRDAEFRRGTQKKVDVLAQIDAADLLLDDLEPLLTDDRAGRIITLPTLPDDDARPGLTWLIGNLGHAREHMGHLGLTVQIFDAGTTSQSDASG